jgi:hypothetical protein
MPPHRLAGRGAYHAEDGASTQFQHRELCRGIRGSGVKTGDLISGEIRRHECRTGEL